MRDDPGTLRDSGRAAPAQPSIPAAPRTIEDSGLGFSFLVELLAKILFRGGRSRLIDLAHASGLPGGIVDQILAFLRAERLAEVAQREGSAGDVQYQLTESGRARAEDFLRHCQYTGPAPVDRAAYEHQVRLQSAEGQLVTRPGMHAAFSSCVISDHLLDQLGVAMNSGRTIFLYGPAGSGKTHIGARLVNVFNGPVYVPHAIAVGSEIVEVFDPLVHRPLDERPAREGRGLDHAANADERWVLCHRPAVLCGGELSPSMLSMDFDEVRRVHTFPAHVKANNGVLVIDDLGRQLVHVRDLLNRWILPLDSRVDFMTLQSGKRFSVPVDVKVVFCTNLRPSELGDEAFLRRLGYRIHVGALAEREYCSIFLQACNELRIPFTRGGLEHVLQRHHEVGGRPMLASTPREILEQIRDQALYLGIAPRLTVERLDWAWDNRFAPERPGPGPCTTEPISEGVVP